MSSLNTNYQHLVENFSKGDLANCQKYLNLLKLDLIKNNYLSASTNFNEQELNSVREILEIGALISIKSSDIQSFERYITQFLAFDADHKGLQVSERRNMMIGLQLLNLLAQNRIADFHLTLESLVDPSLIDSDEYIQFPVELEKALMEGSYNKVLSNKEPLPSQDFAPFMDVLAVTIREEIASCCEKAYKSLPIPQLAAMLFLNKNDEIHTLVNQRNWLVNVDQTVHFRKSSTVNEDDQKETNSLQTIAILNQAMEYARELEQIV